ncbi:MAG: AMP-binding protein [Gemmatimonadetes bacterium]|nr:AMP-binding protein [Gemmatimonadota bacterium]
MTALRDSDVITWRPTTEARARARLTEFMAACRLDSFDALYRRSVAEIEWFTEEVLSFLGIAFDPPYERVLDLSRGVEWPRWCVGGGLNITQACLDRQRETAAAGRPAVIWEGEEGETRELTYLELLAEVERCAAGLRALGFGRGDAAGIHLPMIPETVVALLAVNRVGGVAVPLFSGYGPGAIESRLRDVGATLLFTCDAFPRRGRPVPAKETADQAVERCPAVRHVVVVRRMGVELPRRERRDLWWSDLLAAGGGAAPSAAAVEPTGAEDPLIVLYTSGTTGRPKGILHSHCGFPVKSAQDMAFGTDVGPGTRITWVTDIGWMMGPWLIYGTLILGGTIVLYDGAPDHPGPDRMWGFCARHSVEVLGISPTLVRALMVHGESLVRGHDLSALRILGSTGEPWNPDPWWWLFKKVGGGRVPIVNYSGGTEVSGGILMGNPILPLKPCSFPAPCPGIAADVVDDAGRSVRGQVGELAIRKPWIGMARGFWKDPDRYVATYWSRFPGLWVHGDWARVDDDGFWYILGRSDDTLKVGGKRVGPAEVESVLVGHPEVAAAAVVGVPHELKGEAIVAFCVAAGGRDGDAALALELKERVAAELGKPLCPERVLFVRDLPRTRNAKVMRRLIRAAYLGEDPGDLSALENPEAVEAIRALRG